MLKENIAYIENLKRFGIKYDLNQIKSLCELLNNSQNNFPSIHIAGTNGKGSTATLIANILKEAGYKVGLYTSPYITNFNERIKINNEPISDQDLDILITKLRNLAEEKNLEVTFFEFTTAIAFEYFSNNNVDISVIEAGLGGKLDATNILDSIISVITNIGLDHTSYLGETKKEIATKKAGIIKPNQIFITGEHNEELRNYFKEICNKNNTEFIYTNDIISASIIRKNLDNQTFITSGIINTTLTTKLLGNHQIENILIALATIKQFENQRNISIPKTAIKQAIESTTLPGRIQILSKSPLIIIDAAHNPAGINALVNFIQPLKNKKTLIIGIAKDKDHEKMLKPLAPLFKQIITTEGNFKPTNSNELLKKTIPFNNNLISIPDVKEAIQEALSTSNQEDTILITGSMYMISDALKYLERSKKINNFQMIKIG